MNNEIFTESFDQFASRITPTDLALYAGAGIILWIIFKDKLSPVQNLVTNVINKFSNKLNPTSTATTQNVSFVSSPTSESTDNVFFELVSAWKKTRDLAVKSGCEQAVKVSDEMFPFLSPTLCQTKNNKVQS